MTCAGNRTTVMVPRDRPYQARHVAPASSLSGAEFVEDDEHLKQLVKRGVLVDVRAPQGVFVDRGSMRHSQPVLHARADAVLDEIAATYTARLAETEAEGSQLVISSMTRTAEQQASLQDAGKSPRSAHSFGAAFDISRVQAPWGQCALARETLADVLTEFRAAGKVRLVPESDCVHVTVMPAGQQTVRPDLAS